LVSKSHRESANDARTAAASAELPNVRERELRSADAYDALAKRDEHVAAKSKTRQDEAAARKIIADGEGHEEDPRE
jgi:hypothetical protein